MADSRHAAPPDGPRLTRRALLQGSAALGLAAAGTTWPVATPAQAQTTPGAGGADWSAFDRAVESAVETFGIVGTAVAVVNRTGLVHQRTFGVRDLTTGAPVTPATLFRVASTTKGMTALLVAQFVDQGRLAWDQPVREVWSGFRAPTPELTATLRVRDLLGMGSGLGAQPLTDLQQGYPNPRQLLESVAWLPVLGPPHTQFFYNNTVYAVGGYLPALALGTAPDDLLAVHTQLMQERVFGPVGMTTARKADDPRPFSDDYATGYDPDFTQGIAADPWITVGSFAPVGGTMASVTDMAAYVTLQLRGGTTLGGQRVVSAANLAECWQPGIAIPLPAEAPSAVSDVAYCMGWTTATYGGSRRVLSHMGGEDGFTCNVAFLPEDDLGLVVLTNAGNTPNGTPFCLYTLNLLLEHLFGLNADPRGDVLSGYNDAIRGLADQAAKAVPVDPTTVAPYLGYYEEDFRLAFDAAGALRLRLQNRAWRVVGQPDGSYVIGSGLLGGAVIHLTRDAVGVPQLELQDFGTVRWQTGPD